ncbi:hypothetical protein OROGR_027588 [Orobanche gracilis]
MMRRQPCSRRLPEELISEVLYRVPVRYLLRFRCVCKSWKTLISSPQFVKDYCRISFSITTEQQLVCLTHTDWRHITTYSLQSLCENVIAPSETSSFRVERRYGLIIGSCNGLVCLCDDLGFFKLRNPFTRLTSKRSPSLGLTNQRIQMTMTMYGFGYDQLNNKYKVLITYDFITKLHTFGTKSWTTIQAFPPCTPPLHWWDRVGKFVSSSGSTLNWLVQERDRIISFDLEKETYGAVLLPLPHYMEDGADLPCNLEVLNNCLCLCYLNDIHCVLWSMNMYGIQESWTKLILIPRCKIPRPIGASLHIRPLCISENGLVLMELDSDRLKLQLVMYNALNGKLDYPEIMGPSSRQYMHIYHESSVSPLSL